KQVVSFLGLPIGDLLSTGLASQINFRLIFVGPAIVIESIVLDREVLAGKYVDADTARAEVAVFERDWPFVPLQLQSGGDVAGKRCVVDGDVLVIRIEPETLPLIVIGVMIRDRGRAHVHHLGAAHAPLVEGGLGAAPVVVITFIEVKDRGLIPVAQETNSAVITGNGILYRDIAGREDSQAAPVVPDRFHRIDKYIRTTGYNRADGVDIACRMAKHQPAKDD